MAKRTRVDTSTMTAEEREKYEKQRAAAKAPKPAYLVYRITGPDGSVVDGATVQIENASRNAEEVLSAVDRDRDLKYARFEIK